MKMLALYYGPHHKQFIGKFSPQPHLGIKTCVCVCEDHVQFEIGQAKIHNNLKCVKAFIQDIQKKLNGMI